MRGLRSPSPCLSVVLILAAVLGFPVAIGAAEQPRRGRPIEFSDPKGTEITTNFNSLRSNRGLREIEEDLSKFLPRTFSPGSSLDGVEAPPLRIVPPPNMSNKRAKEARDRRVNWVWQNPQELTKGPKAEELFKLPEYGPDGKEKKNKTDSFESFYERLGRERHSDIEQERERDDDPTEPDKTRAISLEDLKPKSEDTVAKPVNEGERVSILNQPNLPSLLTPPAPVLPTFLGWETVPPRPTSWNLTRCCKNNLSPCIVQSRLHPASRSFKTR